jgi:Trypsin-like peptidase domain
LLTTTESLRQAGRAARSGSAAIVLVIASVVSAVAAVTGLTSWVSVAAAVAALLSGAQVIRSELIVPWRIRAAENATLRVSGRSSERGLGSGTAFQVATNLWVTAYHIVEDCDEVVLMIDQQNVPAEILHRDADSDLAVLSVESRWAWRARISSSPPDQGDTIRIVGWTRSGDGPPVQLAFDYLVQGKGEAKMIAVTGPDHPQRGFSGAPAIDIRSGRVIGIMNRFSSAGRFPADGQFWSPQPVALTLITPISAIPAEYR